MSSAGVVQAVVDRVRPATSRSGDNRWFASDLLRDQVRLAPGDQISGKRLQDDIDWLNQNPFRQVTIVAEKSATKGATDLALDTARIAFPSASMPDTTTPGRRCWDTIAGISDSTGATPSGATSSSPISSHRATISGMAASSFRASRATLPSTAHSVNLIVPLAWRDKLLIFGSYSEAVPRLGPSLGLVGVSGQASTRYPVRCRRSAVSPISSSSATISRPATTISRSAGSRVSNVTREIDQFPVDLQCDRADALRPDDASATRRFSAPATSPAPTRTCFSSSGQ